MQKYTVSERFLNIIENVGASARTVEIVLSNEQGRDNSSNQYDC